MTIGDCGNKYRPMDEHCLRSQMRWDPSQIACLDSWTGSCRLRILRQELSASEVPGEVVVAVRRICGV